MTFDLLYVTFLGITNEWVIKKKENNKSFHLTLFDYARTIDGFDEMVIQLIDSELERGERMINPSQIDFIIDYDIMGNFSPKIDNDERKNQIKMIFRDMITRFICEIYYGYDPKGIKYVEKARIDNKNGTFSTKFVVEFIAPLSTLTKFTDFPDVTWYSYWMTDTNDILDNTVFF